MARHLLQANDLTVNKLEEENKTANQTKEQKEDGEKEIEVVKDVYNNPNSKLAEYKKLAKEALASKKAITPLLLIILGVSFAFVFVFLRYRRLKQHIRYDSLKQNDYYSKLDPDDMAAEQEAQNLINGAYCGEDNGDGFGV